MTSILFGVKSSPFGYGFFPHNAFSYCYALTSLNIPSSLTYIHEDAFTSCSSELYSQLKLSSMKSSKKDSQEKCVIN